MMRAVEPGRRIVRADLAGTAALVVSVGVAALTDAWRKGSVVVALVLFALGVFTFIWAYFSAVERSRSDEIGVANLFLLTGATAPTRVKRVMSAALAVQVVVGLGGALLGFARIEGDEPNLFAFGILVPMFGIGLNGLWASRHGTFGPRLERRRAPEAAASAEESAPGSAGSAEDAPEAAASPQVTPPDHEMEQNAPHG